MSRFDSFEFRRRDVALAATALLGAMSGSALALDIKAVSSRPQYVSGGDALLQVKPLNAIHGVAPTVLVNGADQSANFTQLTDSSGNGLGVWLGLVTGLHLHADPTNPGADPNVVTSSYNGENASLDLWNYPNEGPIFSGPHETPFICTTNYSSLDGSPALIPKNDGLCGVHTNVSYYYSRSSDNAFVPLPAGPYPSGMRTITVPGVGTKPYVIRLETGTTNRALYQIAMLHDVRNEPVPTPTNPSDTWNGRLVYKFGGGCQEGWYQQGRSTAPVLVDEYLSKRYALASGSLNEMRNNCNDLLSSETVMMVKEKFIEAYGPPKFTIGTGGSGGSYQANQTADNYPGLLDGIFTSATFADVNTTTMFKLFDSRLLNIYFPKRTSLSDTKKKAISGYLAVGNVSEMSKEAERIDPAGDFASHFPAGFSEWSPTNTTGARASVYDHTKNVYGVDSSGYAYRPIGNVGVQYGLKALLEGKISSADFIHLNKTIGGLDRNLVWQSARTPSDLPALSRAYQSGRFLHGGGGLKTTPVIDKRDYRDKDTDLHASIHTFAVRERLKKANGDADNHIIRRSTSGYDFSGFTSLAKMDQWLTAIVDDPAPLTHAKVVAKKPSDLVDACKLPSGTIVNETQRPFAGTCAGSSAFPVALTPRIVAGGVLSADAVLEATMLRDDTAECRLRTPVLADYKYNGTQRLSASELSQLTSPGNVFANGVCDWKHLDGGLGQQPVQTWSSFGPSPLNRITLN